MSSIDYIFCGPVSMPELRQLRIAAERLYGSRAVGSLAQSHKYFYVRNPLLSPHSSGIAAGSVNWNPGNGSIKQVTVEQMKEALHVD